MKIERFYDNGEVVIDLEEVGRIEVKPESSKYSHQVIMKHSVWSRENDCYSNDYYFQRDKGYGFEFVEAWKKYKSQQ